MPDIKHGRMPGRFSKCSGTVLTGHSMPEGYGPTTATFEAATRFRPEGADPSRLRLLKGDRRLNADPAWLEANMTPTGVYSFSSPPSNN